VGGGAADASDQLGARAYAYGHQVAFAEAPSLHTAAHEAAHVVQQRGGVSLKGGVGQVGDAYERHADAVADRVVSGQSAEGLFDQLAGAGGGVAPAVQRKEEYPESDGEYSESDDGYGDQFCEASPEEAEHDLGEASNFGEVLGRLGDLLGALAPAGGMSADLNAKVAVTATGVYASLGFSCSVSRTDAGFQCSATWSGSVGVGTKAATSSVHAALKVSSSVTANGDSGSECARLVGLWFHNYLSSQPDSAWEYLTNTGVALARKTGWSKLVADAVMGQGFPAEVLEQMDPASAGAEADTVAGSTSAGIEAEAKDEKAKTGISGGASATSTTTLGTDDAGNLTKSTRTTGQVTITIIALGFSQTIAFDSATGLRFTVTAPLPDGTASSASAVFLSFSGVIRDAVQQLVHSRTLDVPTGKRMVGALASVPQHSLTEMWRGREKMDGTLEFAGTLSREGEMGLTVSVVSTAALPPVAFGAGVGGGSLTASVATKTQILQFP
jgi:hypothetical protein